MDEKQYKIDDLKRRIDLKKAQKKVVELELIILEKELSKLEGKL